MHKLAVIAVGGNALIKDAEHRSVLDQLLAAGVTSHHIADLVEQGYRVVVTHGNGPQVGFILLRSEVAKSVIHQVPLESCVADTQGAIGYQIAQTLGNEFRRRGIQQTVAAVVTQCVVDPGDPALDLPDKPIGPFYTKAEADAHAASEGWTVREDAGRGWRRVVASPEPLEVVEEKAIQALLDRDIVVVAVGGGGIPVTRAEDGTHSGLAAVIDKDAASSLLGSRLGADLFVILTSVPKVALRYGTPEQRNLDKMTLADAKRYLGEGHFREGSMKPKIEAAIRFLEKGGQRVIITEADKVAEAVAGQGGTHIVP
jgi:carbamate kinase